MNILIVAPHPDDEVLGCGGIMAKYAQGGHNIYVAIMTNGHIGAPELFSHERNEMVRSEALQAHDLLGVKQTFFYDYPAPKLDTSAGYQIAGTINKLLLDLEIEVVYLPHRGDIHKDHSVIFQAALVACRPINDCPVKEIFAYETLSETEWAPPFGSDVFIPTVYEDIGDYFQKKIEAIKLFRSQLKEYPHPRSIEILESLAKYRGATVGLPHAEAFALIRSIKSSR